MDTRFIHRLFDSDEIEEAALFMTDKILSGSVPDFKIPYIADLSDRVDTNVTSLIAPFITNIILNTYGVNAPTMANFYIVQDEYFSRYYPHISRYLSLFGMKVENIFLSPSEIITPILVGKLGIEKVASMMSKDFPPDKLWNYEDYNLVHPMNGLSKSFLLIDKITNEDFIKNLAKQFFSDEKGAKMIERLYNKETLGISIQVLPSSNFRTIFSIIENCHKYL